MVIQKIACSVFALCLSFSVASAQEITSDEDLTEEKMPTFEEYLQSLEKKDGEIPVHSPRELNFMSRGEVFSVRKQMMKDHPFIFKDYQIEGPVYDGVVSFKQWPGFVGLNCRGNGEKMSEGLSRESIFIDNPLVLISFETGGFKIPKWDCPDVYPVPTKIVTEKETPKITVTYNFSEYYDAFRRYYRERVPFDIFNPYISGRNARDLGYPYVHAETLDGISFINTPNPTTEASLFRDFVHLATNLGCTCNNGSPYQPEFYVSLKKLPAFIRFKLWKQQPASINDKADLVYEMKIE